MNGTRREFAKALVAMLAFPASAIAATWDKLGCICQKIGAHWTICRKHWKDSSNDDFRAHLKATHGMKSEVDKWPREVLLAFHDRHHEGGTASYKGFSITIPPPSKLRHLKGAPS